MILPLLWRLPIVCALLVASVFCMRWGVEGESTGFRSDLRLGTGMFGMALCVAAAILLLISAASRPPSIPCRWLGGFEDNRYGL